MRNPGWIFLALFLATLPVNAGLAIDIPTEREEQIVRNVRSIFEPESNLLSAGGELEFGKCGTSIVAEASWLWPHLSETTRAKLSQYLVSRPPGPDFFYDTPDGYFRVHYDTAGFDAVDMSHGVDGNGVPIYVKTCADILLEVRQKEIGDLAYPAPPADDFYPEGQTAAYDVYLQALGSGFLGLTYPDSMFRGGTYDLFIATSYMVLDNDYLGYGGYEPAEWADIMSVTAAHEYFHAIQFGLDFSEYWENAEDYSFDTWWHEMSATWMEDIVYDEVNDYYNYLPFFFGYPNWALTTQGYSGARGLYQYGACVWPRFLSERFGNDILREIWLQCGESAWLNSIEAWSDQIAGRGSTLYKELGRFRLWCFYSGDRYRPYSFSEGANYPTIDETQFLTVHDAYPVAEEIGIAQQPEYMGAAYLQFSTPSLGSSFDFDFRLLDDNIGLWAAAAAGLANGETPPLFATRDLTQTLLIPGWQDYESIMVIAMPFDEDYSEYKNIPGQAFSYEASMVQDFVPPELFFGMVPNSVFPYSVDLIVKPSEELLAAVSAVVTVAAATDSLKLDHRIASSDGDLFNTRYHVTSDGTGTIELRGTDLSDNETVDTIPFSAYRISTARPVYALSFDGALAIRGAGSGQTHAALVISYPPEPVVPFKRADWEMIGMPCKFATSADLYGERLEIRWRTETLNSKFGDLDNVIIFQLDGNQWTPLPTWRSSAHGGFVAFTDSLGIFVAAVGPPEGELHAGVMPSRHSLYQNAPNPFNSSTMIWFEVGVTAFGHSPTVTVEVYNILGQRVETLVDRDLPPGRHAVQWNAADDSNQPLPSGVYFARMEIAGETSTIKMVLMK